MAASRCRSASVRASVRSSVRRWAAPCWRPRSSTAKTLTTGSLVPGFITSGTAYAVYGSILGFEPLFGFIAPDYKFDPRQLVWFLVIGIVAAAIGYLYARTFYATVALTHWLPGGPVLKPAIGGLLVGLLALLIPQILSSGYGWAQKAAATETLLAIPLWIVLILPIAKIVATSLSIGTGGSGGIFGPGHRHRRVRRRRHLAPRRSDRCSRNPRQPRRFRRRRR